MAPHCARGKIQKQNLVLRAFWIPGSNLGAREGWETGPEPA
jgi:hypothetical protein